MEIPYTVTARKDTGLFNSKVGIWLFLASEVMLFGGLFSGYVFLRIYADYPWPERALPVIPGLINTFVLIGSSVTVVFAWASLKMRQWRRFQIFMGITIACAGIFMVLKAIEYKAKWEHQAVRMDDFTIVEGHTHPAELDDKGELHVIHKHLKKKDVDFYANSLIFKTEAVSFSLVRAHEPWVDAMLAQAKERGATFGAFDSGYTRTGFYYGSEEDRTPDDPATPEDEQALAEKALLEGELKGVTKPTRFGKDSIYFPKIGLFLYGKEEDRTPDDPATRQNEQEEAELKLLADGLMEATETASFGKGSFYIPVLGVFLYGDTDDFTPDDPRTLENEQTDAEHKLLLGGFKDAKKAMRFGKNSLFVPGGMPLSYAVLKKAREVFITGRAKNAKVRTKILKQKWKEVHAAYPGVHNSKVADQVKIESADTHGKVVSLTSSLSFEMDPPASLVLNRGWVKREVEASGGLAELRDDSSLSGTLLDSPLVLAVDAVDFRWMAQKAEEANKDPMAVIDKSWIFSEKNANAKKFKRAWSIHKKRIKLLEEELKPRDRVPTETERYRIGWKDLVHYARADHVEPPLSPGDEGFEALRPGLTAGFAGPNHKDKEIHDLHAFPELEIPHEKVKLESKFTPKWNTYYAIYFTLTGLHGLHVVGGALVLGYYLFFSKGLYRRNPEWLANRVEVGGLFWHFVDLVWIFLFPILYLM